MSEIADAVGLAAPQVIIVFLGRNFFNVCAKRARCPIFPGFFAALFSIVEEIFSPDFTPNDFLNAPGFLIAF